MAEEDGGGAVPLGGGVQRGVAGVPGGGLGTALAAHLDGHRVDRVQSEGAHPQDDLGGADVGAALEAVVDGDAAGPYAQPGRFEGQCGGEGHGVGAAGARDEHQGGPVRRRGRQRRPGGPRGAHGDRLLRGGRGGRGVRGVVVQYVVKYAADRHAYRGDRWMGTHVRFQSSAGGSGAVYGFFVTQSA